MNRPAALLALIAALYGVAPWSDPAVAQSPGAPERGHALFVEKQCARCHLPQGQQGPGPALETLRRPQGALELAGRLWNHAPVMFALLTREGIQWPPLNASEMGDLMAYLRADPARDPAPALFQGQVTLLRKGCLKCHSLRGEGGRIGPELAARRFDYDSPSSWAATMWVHTPRMAKAAAEMGILYPRFSGHEMVNLVGFLRSAAGAPPR